MEPGVSRTRNLSVTSPILYHYTTAPTTKAVLFLHYFPVPITNNDANLASEPRSSKYANIEHEYAMRLDSCDGIRAQHQVSDTLVHIIRHLEHQHLYLHPNPAVNVDVEICRRKTVSCPFHTSTSSNTAAVQLASIDQ